MTRRNSALVAVAGAATLALLTACRSSGGGSGSSGSAAGGSSPAAGGASSGGGSAKAGKVVYIPGLTGNPFYNTVNCGAKAKAKELGVGYDYQGASTFGVAEQTKVLNAVVATKPGAIMISITDPTAMVGPLTAAKNAGMSFMSPFSRV